MGVRAAMDSAAYLFLSLLYLEGEHFPFPVRPPGSLNIYIEQLRQRLPPLQKNGGSAEHLLYYLATA